MPSERTYLVGLKKGGDWVPVLALPAATAGLKYWRALNRKGNGVLEDWKLGMVAKGQDPDAYASGRAAEGTAVHDAIHRGFMGQAVPDDVPPHYREYVKWKAEAGFTLLDCEYPTASFKHRFAGTVDQRGTLPKLGTGIVDVKTIADASKLRYPVYRQQQAQAVGYAMADLELGRTVDFVAILRLAPTGHKLHVIPPAEWPVLFAAFIGAHAVGRAEGGL